MKLLTIYLYLKNSILTGCGQRFTLGHAYKGLMVTIGCNSKEESHGGLCYKKCSLLAGPKYPLRTASHTCARNGCTSNEVLSGLLCYPRCKTHYHGVGPICWGDCSHFCPGHHDHGIHCYRSWPPHSCYKPRYGRGVGRPQYAPWTKGVGCSGFGVGSDGGCALINIENRLPRKVC